MLVKLYPVVCVMDLIAKAPFLNMIQHNGKYGCKDCLIESSHIQSGKGYAHCYPYADAITAVVRTNESFLADAYEAFRSGQMVCYISLHYRSCLF